MPTLLLSSKVTADSIALREAALQSGWSFVRLTDVEQIDRLKGKHDLVIFGEAVFARLVAKVLGINLLQPPLDWLNKLPFPYLQRHVQYTTLGAARLHPQPAFIKPAGEKSFEAKIHWSGAELPISPDLSDSIPVYIIDPVTWQLEFRCFVLNQEPVTLSIYKRDGQIARDSKGGWIASADEISHALEFCSAFLSDPQISTPPAFVLDVGIIKDAGWAVIETNPTWASGIYGCDPPKALSVIQRACRNTDQLSETDRQWIL